MRTTTHESSAHYQNVLDRTVPSPWSGQLRADLDQLQAYRAAQQPAPDKAAAKKRRALHAGAVKAEHKRAAVTLGVEVHRLQLEAWTNPGTATARAKWLAKQITYDSGVVLGWRYVYDYLKTLHI